MLISRTLGTQKAGGAIGARTGRTGRQRSRGTGTPETGRCRSSERTNTTANTTGVIVIVISCDCMSLCGICSPDD